MRRFLFLLLLAMPALASGQTLVHYWNFNSPAFLQPTTGAGTLSTTLGTASELTTGTGQDFSARNARNGDVAGAHLRLNNPIGASLTVHLPTTGSSKTPMATPSPSPSPAATRTWPGACSTRPKGATTSAS